MVGIHRCLPYSQGTVQHIGLAYSTVMKWIEENGYEIAGHQESYIDGCWNKEDPAMYNYAAFHIYALVL